MAAKGGSHPYEFKSFDAWFNYYRAEGFEISNCRCIACGVEQVASHFPMPISGQLDLQCFACGARPIIIVDKIHSEND